VGLKLWWLWEESTTVVHTVRLSFGEIPWFDEQGEIRRCDWSKSARHTLSLTLSPVAVSHCRLRSGHTVALCVSTLSTLDWTHCRPHCRF